MNGFRVIDVSLARCTNLRTLIVKAEVRDLYRDDFVGCRNLEAIVWDTWNGCFFKPDTFKDCPKLVFYVDDDHSSIIKCCNRAGIPVKSLEDAKELGIYESLRPSRKHLRNRLSEAESMMPDYTEDGSWCIWYYNEADAEFGHDPGPQIVEDNLTQEYAQARAEELDATCEPFEQYWAERERERY